MRCAAFLLVLFLIPACSPVIDPRPVVQAVPETAVPVEAARPTAPVTPARPVDSPRLVRAEISGIAFEGVAFDARSHRLVVADQAEGPGSRFADAAAAGRQRGGIAALNAGFFTPEGAPLGLVVSSGKASGSWNSTSSLGSGIWHEDAAGNPAIRRRGAIDRSAAVSMRELIQAGPLLVENRRPVAGVDATKASARSILLWDGDTRWSIGRTSPCTLADLAAALANRSPVGWPVGQALNLDGGRSSDLWISGSVPGGPLVRRPPWNRPVRNFLILQTR